MAKTTVSLTIDEDLLKIIDRAAEKVNRTRSNFIEHKMNISFNRYPKDNE
jgi:metal-responsive CopG/Arc/MetJ family transcriptional regulator